MLTTKTEMYMNIISIYLFDQNIGMAFVKCGKVAICFKPFGSLLGYNKIKCCQN